MEIHIKFTLSILIFMHLSINQNQRLIHDIWRTIKVIVSFFITYAHFLIYCCLIHWCIHFLFLCPSCYTAHICTFVCMYLCNVGKTPYVFIHGFLLISSAYFTSSVAVIAVMKLMHFMIPKSIFFLLYLDAAASWHLLRKMRKLAKYTIICLN